MTSGWPPVDDSVPAVLRRSAAVFRVNSPHLAPTAATADAETVKSAFIQSARLLAHTPGSSALEDFAAACQDEAARLRVIAGDQEARSLMDRVGDACSQIPECDDPFDALMETVTLQSQSLYASSTPVGFVLRPLVATDRQALAPPFAVSAATFWIDDVPQVELAIAPGDFSPATMAVVPFVLAHEVVCHAFSSHRAAPANSIMAEGVMDWASHWFCENWLRLLPQGCAVDARAHVASFRAQTHVGKRLRARGHVAAEMMVDFLAEHGVPEPEAYARVAHACVALNRLDVPLLEKDLVVTRWTGIDTDLPLRSKVEAWAGDPTMRVEDVLM